MPCPSGYRVTGGGYSVTTGPVDNSDNEPYAQFNAVSNRPNGQGWKTTLKYIRTYGVQPAPNFTVNAICTR